MVLRFQVLISIISLGGQMWHILIASSHIRPAFSFLVGSELSRFDFFFQSFKR
jgi:hypothetical protein